ncbi:MAG: rhombosortase [Thiolinea sp.]
MDRPTLFSPALLIYGLLFSLLLYLLQPYQEWLLYRRESILAGEAWRLWTGHLVHTNPYHLYLNLGGFWIFLLLCSPVLNLKILNFSIILGATLISFAFLAWHPQLDWYAGFSGVLYGLFVTGALCLLLAGDWLIFSGLLLLVAIKLLSGWLGDSDELTQQLIKARIVDEAHYYGALAGLLPPLPRLYRRLRSRTTPF